MRFFRLMPMLTLCALMVGLVVLLDHAPTRRTVESVNAEQRAQENRTIFQQLQVLEARAKRKQAQENRMIFLQLQMLELRATKEMILF